VVAAGARHPLQTSDALGAAAAQLGPDAQAAVVELNKQGGLSHGKVTRCLESLFGIPLSRGGSVHTVLRAASRCEPVYESIRENVGQSDWVVPDETGWRVGGHPAWLHTLVGPEAIFPPKTNAANERLAQHLWAHRDDPLRQLSLQRDLRPAYPPATPTANGKDQHGL